MFCSLNDASEVIFRRGGKILDMARSEYRPLPWKYGMKFMIYINIYIWQTGCRRSPFMTFLGKKKNNAYSIYITRRHSKTVTEGCLGCSWGNRVTTVGAGCHTMPMVSTTN
jgi:hypothetical protein